jgi:hypothetical protein
MAILDLFTHSSPDKHTNDTSVGRSNNYPSIIRDNDGRYIMFYEKRLQTGRLSIDTVTFTSPSLDCTVPAGNGEINSISVSWLSTVLTLSPNSYTLIYVDSSGVVGQTDDFPISFVKDVIILAFAYVGDTSIVRILNTERDGYYVFHRKQTYLGGAYEWDDYEFRLNVGIKPEAVYDSANNKVYLSFQKDGASMVRMFDLTDANTWQDLNHILLVDPTIYPIPQPKVDLVSNTAYSKFSVTDVSPPLFELASDVVVGLETGSNDPYIHIPYVTSSFLAYATFPALMQVFAKSGSVYTLQAQFPIVNASYYNIYSYSGITQPWSYNRGNKYVGLEVEHTLFSGNYITLPFNYASFYIPNAIDETEDIDSTHRETKIYPEIWTYKSSYHKASIEKTTEYGQFFKYSEDSLLNFKTSYHKESSIEKTIEYEQFFKYSEDSLLNFNSAYYNSSHSVVDT